MLPLYRTASYGQMISNQARFTPYVNALRQAVSPASVVLDIGTGPGIFALLACQFGARRVYAVEPAHVIHLARKMADVNGYTDRIVFVQSLSTRLTLPEPADIIISDLRGAFPLFRDHIPTIIDARRRLLAPDGVLIPQRDKLWAAVVCVPEFYQELTSAWQENAYDLDLQAGLPIVTNQTYNLRLTPGQLLTSPHTWADLDYARIEIPHVSGQVNWTMTQAGTAHGLGMGFEARLAQGQTFSNRPDAPYVIYRQMFFPWLAPVSLAAGDQVSVALRANYVGEDYIWHWNTTVTPQTPAMSRSLSFSQSTFFADAQLQHWLPQSEGEAQPVMNEDGQLDYLILSLLHEGVPVQGIIAQVAAQFPARFVKRQAAAVYVSKIIHHYSQTRPLV